MNPNILLVEDDPSDAQLAMLLLREISPGVNICHVSDGVQALDYLEGRGKFGDHPGSLPTIVLLDLKMPRVDGFGVLERLHAASKRPSHPVIVLSSSEHDCDVQRAYKLGASGYVVKSINFDKYRSALQAIWDFWCVHNHPPHTSHLLVSANTSAS